MKKVVSYMVAVFLVASTLGPVFALAKNATSTPTFPRGVKEGELERVRERLQEFHGGGTATSTPAVREDMRKAKEELRKQEKEAELQKREDMRKAKEELRKQEKEEKLQKMIKKMTERFTAAIHREEKLADRIASRLDRAAQNGKDVSALRQKLSDARLKIADAKTTLDATVAKLQTVIASSTAKKWSVPNFFSIVTEKLKMAHAALVDVMNSLKGIGNTATTTPQNP